ncbi:MAG: MraY family glycosyltransferase [Phycisphaerae bacterium]|jgi:UDP-GlcNAc:undecaprenyl-phosphate GlcNAc-1-phosphate transferase
MDAFWDLLSVYGGYGLTAFVVAVFATPLAMRVAQRFGVMDFPDTFLKPHAKPTPYLGGAAICLAWTLALIVGLARGIVDWPLLLPVLLGGVAISIMGLVDDIRGIAPKWRLIIGAVIVAAVLITTGAGGRLVEAMLGQFGFSVPGFLAVPASVVISLLIVLGACNSANLIDGLDGLCSGVTAIISLGFFLLASHLALWGYSQSGDPLRLLLAIAMCGAAIGFLPWNFNPARIFMGDAGSVLLGYNCGLLIVLFAEQAILRWVIAALMIFALPIFDTALAMFRRWRSGRSIFEGDRSHFYDQLVHRGLSVRQTVLISYGLTMLYVGAGLLMMWVRPSGPVIRTRYAVPLYVAVCVLTALVAYLTGLTHPEERPAPRPAAPPKSES